MPNRIRLNRERYLDGKNPIIRELAKQRLVQLHDDEKKSFEQIAEMLGCSRERVTQLYNWIVLNKTKGRWGGFLPADEDP